MIDERAAQLLRERPAERVWLLCDDGTRADFDDVAVAAGIAPLGRAWIELDEDHARRVLAGLLRTSLAHSIELMREHRAQWLAQELLGAAGRFGARFVTNIEWFADGNGATWEPATELAYDAGIIVLGASGSVCYWVAEDA